MPKRTEEEAVELLTWDPSDGTEEDEECDDELPADEAFAGDEDEAEEVVAEVDDDGFSKDRPAELPQPDRARSHPDLPKVKSGVFKRIIR